MMTVTLYEKGCGVLFGEAAPCPVMGMAAPRAAASRGALFETGHMGASP